jgi:hypothetical protein
VNKKLQIFTRLGPIIEYGLFQKYIGQPKLIPRSELIYEEHPYESIDSVLTDNFVNYATTVLRASGIGIPDPDDELILKMRNIRKKKEYPSNIRELFIRHLDMALVLYNGVPSPSLQPIRGAMHRKFNQKNVEFEHNKRHIGLDLMMKHVHPFPPRKYEN